MPKMSDHEIKKLYDAAISAEKAWSDFGIVKWGKRWGDVRYTLISEGEHGSELRKLYDNFLSTKYAWMDAWKDCPDWPGLPENVSKSHLNIYE